MTQSHRENLTKRFLISVRILFAALGAVSLVLGYVGLRAYVNGRVPHEPQNIAPLRGSGSDLAFYDFQLIFGQSPALSQQEPGPMTLPLEVARFGAPTILLYPLTELGIALAVGRLRLVRQRRARGHAVVCGTTRAADTLADRLRAAGTRVITIEPFVGRRDSLDVVAGDPAERRTLLNAAVQRASSVYACLERSEDNAMIVNAVEEIRSERGYPHRLYALVSDLDLCAALKARQWSASASGAPHLDFFTPDELAARTVVGRDDGAFASGPPEIAVVGTGAFARAVVVEFGRQWVTRRGTSAETMRATLVGHDAAQAANELRDRYPFLGRSCRIQPRTESLDRLLAQRRDASAPRLHRLYLCQADEGEALKTALASAAYLRSAVGSIVVRLDRMAGMAEGFQGKGGPSGVARLDALGGRLRMVDVIGEGCDPELISEDLTETLARACHQRFLVEHFEAGAERGSTAAMVPWEELPEEYRDANRDLAADVGRKLNEIGCLLTPRAAGEPAFAYQGDEIERLAEREHTRWMAERRRGGWVYGARRDEAAKRHPALVPWAELSDEQKEKDRQAVRGFPAMLADAGLVIVRTGPSGRDPDPEIDALLHPRPTADPEAGTADTSSAEGHFRTGGLPRARSR